MAIEAFSSDQTRSEEISEYLWRFAAAGGMCKERTVRPRRQQGVHYGLVAVLSGGVQRRAARQVRPAPAPRCQQALLPGARKAANRRAASR